MKPIKIEMPEIGKETSIGAEFREMMSDVGIHIYSKNDNRF